MELMAQPSATPSTGSWVHCLSPQRSGMPSSLVPRTPSLTDHGEHPSTGPLHSVSVTGVAVRPDGGRVLVTKRADDGRWVPPGDVLELAGTPEQCVAREVREGARRAKWSARWKKVLNAFDLAFDGRLTPTRREPGKAVTPLT